MNALINPGIDVDKLTVLVVDDVPLNVLLIKKMLSQYTFQLKTANSGQAALDIIAQSMPDLLLLDLMILRHRWIRGYSQTSCRREDKKVTYYHPFSP